jgi:hypothetical protein
MAGMTANDLKAINTDQLNALTTLGTLNRPRCRR